MNDYAAAPLSIVTISSNDVEKLPARRAGEMKALAEQLGWTFPYCLDESQELAKTFQAACTPDFYVFGKDKRLTYRGQFDDSRPKNDAASLALIYGALDAMLAEPTRTRRAKAEHGLQHQMERRASAELFSFGLTILSCLRARPVPVYETSRHANAKRGCL